ncbi:Tyrosine recombinase XerD [Klebsiella pneumoniae]|nr:Tyrosine recombinase XerD [Klebsiella pneumoniae]
MSTGFVPSSVSTVCVTRQPWRSRGEHPLANERKVSVSRIVRHWRPCCSSTARCCARICPASEIGRPRPSRRLPVVLTPDEVVRILGFLEGEHRLFAQLLYGTGMRISEGLQLRVKDLDFDHGTIIVREGKGSKDRALMLPESLAPSLREQLSRARAWWLKDQAEGRSGVALPDALERKYPRAGHLGRGSGFCAAHAFDRSTAVSCVAITCMTRPFSAPSNVP